MKKKKEYIIIKKCNWTKISISLFFSLLVLYQLVVVEIMLWNSGCDYANYSNHIMIVACLALLALLLFADSILIGIIIEFFRPYCKKYKLYLEPMD